MVGHPSAFTREKGTAHPSSCLDLRECRKCRPGDVAAHRSACTGKRGTVHTARDFTTSSRRPSSLAMASLEDKLSCAICLQLYQAPATLPCGHNFCYACIQKWEPQNQQCPTCRTPFCGDTDLRRNVEFSEVVDMVRDELDRRPGELPAPDPDPGLELATKPAPRCPRHGWPLELFCRTEGRCVCCACTVRDCHGHQRALLRIARRDREAQLKAALETQWQQQQNRTEQQLQELKQKMLQIQTSACTVASVVSDKFSHLLQALEERRASALRDLEEARSRASAQAQEEEQRLQRHLQALAEYDSRARAALEQEDDVAFLQGSQLLMLPAPVEPPSPPQWDEEQQVGGLKKWLSQLAGLLLEEGAPQAPAEAAGSHPPVCR
ncbi:tripartite motif-containing protein 65-like [Suncus etruscus]|uniref:tripartite motif-containing protein 65-like n=1 Tax=Suncus etruscus TaxID=109475 RepID=UPI00211059BB|nr:tripartite motif-containing protein 65-like [Suncus etruscus]